MLVYRSNQFIQNKIIRVFELLNSEDNLENQEILLYLKDEKMINASLISKLIENINFSKYINLEK